MLGRLGSSTRCKEPTGGAVCMAPDANVNDGGGGMGWDFDEIDFFKNASHGAGVVLQGFKERWGRCEDVDSFGGADSEQSGNGGREDECSTVDALRSDNASELLLRTVVCRLHTWCSVTWIEPAQKPPVAHRPFAMDPTTISTSVAYMKKIVSAVHMRE